MPRFLNERLRFTQYLQAIATAMMDEMQSFAETIGDFAQTVAADNEEHRRSRRSAHSVVQTVVHCDGKVLDRVSIPK